MNKILKLLMALILLTLLSACAGKERIVYQTRYVPVAVIPTPPEVTRPTLLIHELSAEERLQNPSRYVQTFQGSFVQVMSYAVSLEEIYDKYKEQSIESQARFDRIVSETDPIIRQALIEEQSKYLNRE